MSIINSATYRILVEEDLAWLKTMPRTLERDHIEIILKWNLCNAETVVEVDRKKSEGEPRP